MGSSLISDGEYFLAALGLYCTVGLSSPPGLPTPIPMHCVLKTMIVTGVSEPDRSNRFDRYIYLYIYSYYYYNEIKYKHNNFNHQNLNIALFVIYQYKKY